MIQKRKKSQRILRNNRKRIFNFDIIEQIYNNQEDLGEDFRKVLEDNLWDLYGS